MAAPKNTNKVSWIAIIGLSIALLGSIGSGIAQWYSLKERIILLENKEASKDLEKVNQRIDKLSDKMDEKNSRMWQAISGKADKK